MKRVKVEVVFHLNSNPDGNITCSQLGWLMQYIGNILIGMGDMVPNGSAEILSGKAEWKMIDLCAR